MKIIGLIGGISWESSLEYYRIINEIVKKRVGEYHSARILMFSTDFNEIAMLQDKGDWVGITSIITDIAQLLERSGAHILLICSNTIHKIADIVQNKIHIPLIHIVDTTAENIKDYNLKKVGLLGTIITMEEDYFKRRLTEKYGIEVIVPNKEEQKIVHNIIFNELVLGKINSRSKELIKKVILQLKKNGAEGIILGCTELPLLIKQNEINVPLFDTLTIHATAAVNLAMNEI